MIIDSNDKDDIIKNLNTNLEYVKNERDEKIVQMKKIIHQMDNFESKSNPVKQPTNNTHGSKTPEYIKEFKDIKDIKEFTSKRIRSNKDSLFSIISFSTAVSGEKGPNNSPGTSSFEEKQNEIQIKIEKLQSQKVFLENDLVHYKLKYAEYSSKIMDLEDSLDIAKEKNDVS